MLPFMASICQASGCLGLHEGLGARARACIRADAPGAYKGLGRRVCLRRLGAARGSGLTSG